MNPQHPFSRTAARKRFAFTLIELLIVVAIIAILAAIAVPNFLEAQTRGKIARAKSDLRTLRTAIESYAVDHSKYPRLTYFGPPYNDTVNGHPCYNTLGQSITTPISYISSIPLDLFANRDATLFTDMMYQYGEVRCIEMYRRQNLPHPSLAPLGFPGFEANYGTLATVRKMRTYMGQYYIWSHGPLGTQFTADGDVRWYFQQYDPTNGTASEGRIFISQKFTEQGKWFPTRFDTAG